MSDNWIVLVPADTGHVPSLERQMAGLAIFTDIATDADEVRIVRHEGIGFFDCGANFEAVSCPHCRASLDMGWWDERMIDDYVPAGDTIDDWQYVPGSQAERLMDNPPPRDRSATPGFRLRRYELPCCGGQAALNELTYEWPQAFGAFGLDAQNPNIGLLSPEQISQVETALGCRLVVIYQHI